MSSLLDKIGTFGIHLSGWATTGLLAVSCSGPAVPSKPGVALLSAEPWSAPNAPLRVQAGGLEERVAAKINQYRARHGRAPFARHGGLDRLAAGHSEEMARSRKMSHHGFPERAQRAESRFGLVWTAENVIWGYGYEEGRLADTIVNSWIESGGHRKNLLRDNTYLGIGIVRGAGGSVWATQLSGRRQ